MAEVRVRHRFVPGYCRCGLPADDPIHSGEVTGLCDEHADYGACPDGCGEGDRG